jgi:NAD(P)-dependent dehydrogenase (short-subunit alcohol dehydrogenase family)
LRDFTDKGVIITGAGRGIGKRFAIGFADAGARVGLISRTLRDLDAAALEIAQAGGHAYPADADVRDYAKLAQAVHTLKRKLHTIDLLVAAAGVQGPIGPFVESQPALWPEMIETNLLGVMNAVHAVLPFMIKQRSGKIIVLAGGGSGNARANFAPYAAAKTAIVRLVETIAAEVRDHNVQVNCFAPGGSYTSMTDEILSAGDRAGVNEIRDAENVRMTGGVPAVKQIQFAKFLASERSNHITGKMIHVTDNLKQLEHANMTPDLFTLRRLKS